MNFKISVDIWNLNRFHRLQVEGTHKLHEQSNWGSRVAFRDGAVSSLAPEA